MRDSENKIEQINDSCYCKSLEDINLCGEDGIKEKAFNLYKDFYKRLDLLINEYKQNSATRKEGEEPLDHCYSFISLLKRIEVLDDQLWDVHNALKDVFINERTPRNAIDLIDNYTTKVLCPTRTLSSSTIEDIN